MRTIKVQTIKACADSGLCPVLSDSALLYYFPVLKCMYAKFYSAKLALYFKTGGVS